MTNSDHSIAPIPHPIDFKFYNKQTNKTTQLANSAVEIDLEGTNRWYEFNFNQSIYLTEIQVWASGYGDSDKFEIEVFHIDGTQHSESLRVEENTISLSLGKLTSGFQFRPNVKWIKQTKILRVVATGYTLDEFHEYEAILGDIRSRALKVNERETKYEKLIESKDELETSIVKLSNEVGILTAQRNEVRDAASGITDQIEKYEAASKDLKKDIINLQEERREIRSQILTDEMELTNLTRKIRLFPSEMVGFVSEGTRNIRNYLLFSLPFTIILVVALYSMFSSAIDLTQLWKKEDNIDIWTIFLTRIPFVLIAVALVETCGFIVGRFAFEIVKINRQRLEFSKLSIIAKDVTTATAAGTEMTEEEVFAKETVLKMNLLQEHMKSQSHEEFRYSGSAISSAVIQVASKLTGGKS